MRFDHVIMNSVQYEDFFITNVSLFNLFIMDDKLPEVWDIACLYSNCRKSFFIHYFHTSSAKFRD